MFFDTPQLALGWFIVPALTVSICALSR